MIKLDALIDRLQQLTEIKYPNRKWTEELRIRIKFEWLGKEEQLEERIKNLEQELLNNN